jgi:putative ABC transport system ATP-binding protein
MEHRSVRSQQHRSILDWAESQDVRGMGKSPLLSVQNLGRQIDGRWIWQEISFSVNPGDRLAVVGASGTGKSLLLRAIAALDPVQAGEIWFAGRALRDWSIPQYRAQVIYLHQRPALPEGSIEAALCQVYRFASHRQATYDRDRILFYLKHLGRSPQFLEQSTRTLSGGESQIAAFLRALQLSPQLLLLDEPTASLDPETAQQIEALVMAWQAEDPQRAYLWTSHAPEQIQRVTERAIALSQPSEAPHGSTLH